MKEKISFSGDFLLSAAPYFVSLLAAFCLGLPPFWGGMLCLFFQLALGLLRGIQAKAQPVGSGKPDGDEAPPIAQREAEKALASAVSCHTDAFTSSKAISYSS